MTATVRQIVDDALEIVGEVDGAGSQTYDDDRMMAHCVRGFNIVFKKYTWPQYSKWLRGQLDGTLGVVSTDLFDQVRDFEDIISVHLDATRAPLPRLPQDINPYSLTATGLQYWTSLHSSDANYVGRRLQFYPVTATDYVNVLVRQYPLENGVDWVFTDTMYLDRDLLAHATAYMGLSGDDLNTNNAEVQKALMEARFRDIVANLSRQPIPIAGDGGVPTDWWQAP